MAAELCPKCGSRALHVEDTDVGYCNACGKTWSESEPGKATLRDEVLGSQVFQLHDRVERLEPNAVGPAIGVASAMLSVPPPEDVSIHVTGGSMHDATKVGALLEVIGWHLVAVTTGDPCL
jgi:hypothetical protein